MNFKPKFLVGYNAKGIRALLQRAISEHLAPVRVPDREEQGFISLYLASDVGSQVEALAAKHKLSPADVISRLSYAALKGGEVAKSEVKSEPVAAVSIRDRLQRKLYEDSKAAMMTGAIVLAEASTGIGKTRVGAWIAGDFVASSESDRVWVGVPSVQNVLQTYSEYRSLGEIDCLAVALGRSQFISEKLVREGIAEIREAAPVGFPFDELEAVERWLDSGCPPLTPASLELAESVPDLSHLVLDLQSICSLFPTHDCLMGQSEDSLALASYQAVRDWAMSSRVVVCTHAMLAITLLRKKEDDEFPWTHLVVDEAHLLEESVAMALSSDVSFLRVGAYLRRKSGALAAKAKAFKSLEGRLSGLSEGYVAVGGLTEEMASLGRNTAKLIKGKKSEDLDWKDRLLRLADANEVSVHLSKSPILKRISLVVGPRSTAGLLKRLWESVDSAVLLSGTLYLPLKNGKHSCSYQRLRLKVPSERAYSMEPVVAPWVKTAPVLHVPKAADYGRFEFNSKCEDDVARWEEEMANQVFKIAKAAKGGVLCLSNSVSEAANIRGILPKLGMPKSQIVPGGISLSAASDIFRSKQSEGVRSPVWIGTGPAWTGLDLRDKSKAAADDLLLTDLVVFRLPYNANRSSTHIARKEWMGYSAEVYETAFRLKQGLGRLIRSEGLLHRNLWVLDSRIWSRQSNVVLRRVVDYPSVKFI